MSPYISTMAFILRAQNYKEADQLLNVYTYTHGKITVLAKGVKKTQSKLRGSTQVFSQTELTLVTGKSLPVVINAHSVDNFTEIKQDFLKMTYASYVMELLDRVLIEGEPDADIFIMILKGMQLLTFATPWVATKYIEIKLLNILGYSFSIDQCQNCGQKLDRKKKCTIAIGGVLCTICGDCKAPLLSMESFTILYAIMNINEKMLSMIYISSQAKIQIDQFIDLQINQIIDRPLKTRTFLRDMIG